MASGRKSVPAPVRLWAGFALIVLGCGGEDPAEVGGSTTVRDCPGAAGVSRETAGDFGADGESRRRVVLMGGSAEVDAAARSFVAAAGGGDVLVLRASGSTSSYNGYFLTELGAEPAAESVTTIRIDDPDSSASSAVGCMIGNADAVWLAGGDQWDYVGRWTSSLHSALETRVSSGPIPIGGTSAGAMVLGEAAFDAEHGSVTSPEALANPLGAAVSVSLSPMAQPELAGWIVDSHFSQREREGRMLAFLARMPAVTGRDTVYGVGLDERAALILEDGAYEVLAGTAGRSVWLYRLIGPVTLDPGAPLDLAEVLRVELDPGATGPWPPSFEAADTVRVMAGVVENGM